MNRRLSGVLLLAALAASGCSAVDCNEPFVYHDARLAKPIATPTGLAAPATQDSYAVPGTPPGDGYTTGACLVKPPQLVEPPSDEDEDEKREVTPPAESAKG